MAAIAGHLVLGNGVMVWKVHLRFDILVARLAGAVHTAFGQQLSFAFVGIMTVGTSVFIVGAVFIIAAEVRVTGEALDLHVCRNQALHFT